MIMKYIPYYFVFLKKAYDSKHSLDVYVEYFEKCNGFLIAFAVALIVALLIALVFYFGFGTKKLKFCSNNVWVGSLVLCLLLSFYGTFYSTGVTSISNSKTGQWGIVKVLNEKQKKISQEDASKMSDLKNLKNAFKKPLFKSAPIRALCVENTILAGLFFLFFSWIFRRNLLPVTNFARTYPTFWPVKKKSK